VNNRTDRAELQDQITQLPIKRLFSLNEFLNLKDKATVNKNSNIFVVIIKCYSVNQPGEEEKSSDKEEQKAKQIKDAKELRMIERLKL
jgi:hypothetical protein